MKNIILLAPPAAGKGTQSKLICDTYKFIHISTGDLLREEVKKETTLGIDLKDKMETGKLIEDSIVIELLKNKLDACKNAEGFIYDGFPRNIKQAELLDEMLKESDYKIDEVIYLNLDYETAKNRIVGRCSCTNCGEVYNTLIEAQKPKKEGICDKCNSNLYKRNDDNEETFKTRFEVYEKETKPLIKYYENIVKEVDSTKDTNEVFEEIKSILGEPK